MEKERAKQTKTKPPTDFSFLQKEAQNFFHCLSPHPIPAAEHTELSRCPGFAVANLPAALKAQGARGLAKHQNLFLFPSSDSVGGPK